MNLEKANNNQEILKQTIEEEKKQIESNTILEKKED